MLKRPNGEAEFLNLFENYLRVKKIGKSTNTKKMHEKGEAGEDVEHQIMNTAEHDPIASSDNLQEEYKKAYKPSTIKMYPYYLKQYLLPAYYKLYIDKISNKPCSPLWMIDCTSEKQVFFDGTERNFIDSREPLYWNPRIVEEATKIIDSYEGHGNSERGLVLATAAEVMLFIERHFSSIMATVGPGPLDKLRPHHDSVRSYMTACGAWRLSNLEKQNALQNKKSLKNHLNPNEDADILVKHKEYLKGDERAALVQEFLICAKEDSPAPSPEEFLRFTYFVIGLSLIHI